MHCRAKILIVDDHPLFREGLKAIIARANEFEVVGEAGSGGEAMRLALELRPDLALVDISLPDQSGIQLTKELAELLPETATMIVSVHCGNNYYAEAFDAGAKGYLVKEAVPEKLLRGLRVVSEGGLFLDETVSRDVIKQLKGLCAARERTTETDCTSLTSRQREVLELLALGHTYKTIGEILCVSPRTVEKHRATIMSKLGLAAKADLTIFALKHGIIKLDPPRT
jgi:DNA-binding NarL/FixJ family response regulator